MITLLPDDSTLPIAALIVSALVSAPSAAQEDLRSAMLDVLGNTRAIDGVGNNVRHPERGAADTEFLRLTAPAYADGTDAPSGGDRPSARLISNLVCSQTESRPNLHDVSDFVWQWGQFLDHDIDETPILDPAEPFPVTVPVGDPWFDPFATGASTIPLSRSFYEHDGAGVRQQINEITAFIDASNVYGSDPVRARALRTLDGTGRLRVSAGDLLPYNDAGLANAPDSSASFFLAGDVRANEQVGLTAMHTLFVREHNHWADRIREEFSSRPGSSRSGPDRHPNQRRRSRGRGRDTMPSQLSGDEIYEVARAIVAAEMQAITYDEFLPVLLGPNSVSPYRGYRRHVDPGITNEFATACYRFGHTMLSPMLRRIDAWGQSIGAGDLPLQSAFFAPSEIAAHGIEPLLRGLASQRAQTIDTLVVDDVRNFLFGPPGAGGFDLVSLNIQRGRDHGIASYAVVRSALGLSPVRRFEDISSDPETRVRLAAAYASPAQVDLWVGGLAEDAMPGALVGPTIGTVLRTQFEALRDGDRYWWESYLPRDLRSVVRRQSLARIIRRNTEIGAELTRDLWHVR